MKLCYSILLPLLLAAGCVGTVNDRKTAGVPFLKDRIEGRYERTPQEVFDAAVEVLKQNGTLQNEATLFQDEDTARTLEGRVNKRRVWIRVEAVDETVTSVLVQARTSAGGSDRTLAFELEKQIAIQLVNP